MNVFHFLLPAFASQSSRASRVKRGLKAESRRQLSVAEAVTRSTVDETVAKASRLGNENELGQNEVEQIDATTVQTQPVRSKSEWISLIDPYLPLDLRSRTWLENLADFEGVRSISDFPKILNASRASFHQGILAHLALVQGRWEALSWLLKCLIGWKRPPKVDLANEIARGSPWAVQGSIFDLRKTFIQLGPMAERDDHRSRPLSHWTTTSFKRAPGSSYKTRSEWSMAAFERPPGPSFGAWKEAIAHVWQCLGFLIIDSIRKDTEDSRRILSFVQRTIAYMHSENVISSSLYAYDSIDASPTYRKSPLLHLLSSRIMTNLSDATWKAAENELAHDEAMVAATYAFKGQQMPGLEASPRVLPLGPQIWLELVLWSCVHGGHFNEAITLIRALNTRKGKDRWKAISWQSLQNSSKQLSSTPPSRIRSWFDRIAGAGEGYSEQAPAVELPKRTISSEVVVSVLDGFLTTATQVANTGEPKSLIWSGVESCKEILSGSGILYDPTFWNSLILRYLDLVDTSARPDHTALGHAVQLAQTSYKASKKNRRTDDSESLTGEVARNQESPVRSFLLRILDSCVRTGDINGALRAFEKLRSLVDHNKGADSAEHATEHVKLDKEVDATEIESTMWLPYSTLAGFLNLITAARLYDLGRSLMYTNNFESPVIPRTALTSPTMHPALLRFAVAASDFKLLTLVTQSISSRRDEIPEETLRELFFCQLALGRWESVYGILKHAKMVKRMVLSPKDVALVARELLLTAELRGTHLVEESDYELRTILMHILGRAYLPSPDPSQAPDYVPYRELNQLSHMLASVPGKWQEIGSQFIVSAGQAQAPVPIPTEAFNILLEAVVITNGLVAGRAFFDKWCKVPDANLGTVAKRIPKVRVKLSSDDDKVVVPDLETIRILITPVLHEISNFFQQRQEFSQPRVSRAELTKYLEDGPSKGRGGAKRPPSTPNFPLPPSAPYRESLQWCLDLYRQLHADPDSLYDILSEMYPQPRDPESQQFQVSNRADDMEEDDGLIEEQLEAG